MRNTRSTRWITMDRQRYRIFQYWKDIYNNDRHRKWVPNWRNITTKMAGRLDVKKHFEFENFGQNYGSSFTPIS